MSDGSDDRVLERVRNVIAESLQVPLDDVRPDAKLGEDLGADSLAYIGIQFQLETCFGVEFNRAGLSDLIEESTSRSVECDGALTEFGSTVLRCRMPEVDAARLQTGEAAIGFEACFTPRTWARVIEELTAARPTCCPKCGDERIEVTKPSLMRCRACGAEIRCPRGEECFKTWLERHATDLACEPKRVDSGRG